MNAAVVVEQRQDKTIPVPVPMNDGATNGLRPSLIAPRVVVGAYEIVHPVLKLVVVIIVGVPLRAAGLVGG